MSENNFSDIKSILKNHEERIQRIEEFIKRIDEKISSTKIIKSSGISRLSQKIGIPEEKINELFDIEEDQLTIIKTIGEKDKEKTKNTTLLVLIGYKYLFNTEEVLAREIKRNVAENNIPLNNFATYINEMSPSLVRRKGKLRSPKTTYKLTPYGEAKARELIKLICGNENVR